MTLFDRLRLDAGADWDAYVRHRFLDALGDGTLPADAFRRYLVQDTLFLFQFARAYGLAAFKSDTLDELRRASATLSALLEVEMPLHLRFCARWGLDERAMSETAESLELIAYTRFVHERGVAGDRLDLEAALAPCVVGYAEIGARLAGISDPASHPYGEWIAIYAGADYQSVAAEAVRSLDRLWSVKGSAGRYASLLATFRQATRLEAAFWGLGFA